MSVLILTKPVQHEIETIRLFESFENKNIRADVCQFHLFDIVVNHGIFYNGKPFEMPDAVLVRMGAGITRKELAVVRYFELAGIPCYNTSQSINLVQDKFQTSALLNRAGIAVPSTMLARYPIPNDLVSENIKFPCVVKVIVGSYGEGIYKCNTAQEYKNIIELIDAVGDDKTLLVQEYLGDQPGEDLRVIVVGGKVIGAMKRIAPVGDFRANITIGGKGEVHEVTPEIEEIALNAARILGLDIAGIDLLFDHRGFRVCEANSNPGFNGFNQFCNTQVEHAISEFIINKIYSQGTPNEIR